MELKNTSELSKLIDLLKKKGVTRIKSGDFEMELSPSALFPISAYKKKKGDSDSIETDPYNENDALFWSSAGIPDEVKNA